MACTFGSARTGWCSVQQGSRAADGKLIKTPKDRLKQQSGLGRGRGTNMRITMRAFDNAEDLLATFKAFVAERLEKNDSDGQSAA